jgi:hypothetical protein
MAKVVAVLQKREAPLASEFGLEWAQKLFGAETLAALPKYVKGPKAGQPKGYVHWVRCETGGWSREFGGVCRPDEIVRAWIAPSAFSGQSEALRGPWCGRTETLNLAGAYLFEEGRQRRMELG